MHTTLFTRFPRMAGSRRFQSGALEFQRLTQNIAMKRGALPELSEKLLFGTHFSDHMLEIDWSAKSGWGDPSIHPLRNMSLHPASSVFHYAIQCFEGTKIFRAADGQLLSFRLDANIQRFARSMARCGMPQLSDQEMTELTHLIEYLVQVDGHFVPAKPGYSMYIRPTAISTTPSVGVKQPSECKIFAICSTVGPYYPTGFKPVKLFADSKITRVAEGGVGAFKMGCNYAPTILLQAQNALKGFDQILWLYPKNGRTLITEVGTMNLFLVVKRGSKVVLVTPPLSDLILPGITRDCVLQLARAGISELPLDEVAETDYSMEDLLEDYQSHRVLEIFGSGTAAVITSVSHIEFQGQALSFPVDQGMAPYASYFHTQITKIQLGVDQFSDWTTSLGHP